MKKILLVFCIIILLSGCSYKQKGDATNTEKAIDCVSEPRDIMYDENCCSNLKMISGLENPDGSCECSKNNSELCVGANTCAPCGNNKCETEYKENKCSCPEDCK